MEGRRLLRRPRKPVICTRSGRRLLLSAASFCVALTCLGQSQDPLERRAHDVASFLGAQEVLFSEYFSEAFLEQVGAPQLEAIFANFHSNTGRVTSVVPDARQSPLAGKFQLHTDGGFAVPIDLVVDPEPPHLITGLWLSPPVPLAGSFDELVAEFEKLHGTAAFQVKQLTPRPEVIASIEADSALALGSGFKLFVLSALHQAILDGDLEWESVVRLDPARKSLPSGILQQWPDNAPLTIHSLASLMISRSDNTATDALIHIVGRDKVEATVKHLAVSSAARNLPFLTTLELFQLKHEPEGPFTSSYLLADESERRAILEGGSAPPAHSLRPFQSPTLISEIEWFASADEMSMLLDDLRSRFEEEGGEELKSILSINPGIDLNPAAWPYIGFKGGSEPGVLHLSYLLQAASGEWFTVVATWNDPDSTVRSESLAGLVRRAADLILER